MTTYPSVLFVRWSWKINTIFFSWVQKSNFSFPYHEINHHSRFLLSPHTAHTDINQMIHGWRLNRLVKILPHLYESIQAIVSSSSLPRHSNVIKTWDSHRFLDYLAIFLLHYLASWYVSILEMNWKYLCTRKAYSFRKAQSPWPLQWLSIYLLLRRHESWTTSKLRL